MKCALGNQTWFAGVKFCAQVNIVKRSQQKIEVQSTKVKHLMVDTYMLLLIYIYI